MINTVSPTRKCGTCGKTGLERAEVPYSTELKHDGRTYPIEVADLPAIRCPHCAAISLTSESFVRLDAALHEAARLMTAAEITERRRALRLQKRQLAHALRMAPETITRFERGARIQSAHYDLMLRLYLASGYVRSLVAAFHAGKDIFQVAGASENSSFADWPPSFRSLRHWTQQNTCVASVRLAWQDLNSISPPATAPVSLPTVGPASTEAANNNFAIAA